MHRMAGAWALIALLGAATPALADFSGCESAYTRKDPREQIDLYTVCLTKGGLPPSQRAGAFNNRGVAHLQLGETDKAFEDFDVAVQLEPDWGTAYLNRGDVFASRGEWAKAKADFDQAVRVGPTGEIRADALRHDAWLLATCPDSAIRDGHRAVELAQKAIKREDGPTFRDTLAAADAEAAQFDQAQLEEARAIELARSKGQTDLLAAFEARLELYRKGVPFRD